MYQPARTKFRKAHKGRIHGFASRCDKLNFGEYGLKALQPERIISKQNEAARVALTRYMTRTGKVWLRIFPNILITPSQQGANVGFDKFYVGGQATGAFDFGDLGGTHDTDIDFRFTNKYRLEMTNDITNMNLIFPNLSGNFLLVCNILGGGGGDHDVTNWKVYKQNEVAASTTDVMWAGGSVPAFTPGAAVDIVSFYWDADEQQAYGTASLAFATP